MFILWLLKMRNNAFIFNFKRKEVQKAICEINYSRLNKHNAPHSKPEIIDAVLKSSWEKASFRSRNCSDFWVHSFLINKTVRVGGTNKGMARKPETHIIFFLSLYYILLDHKFILHCFYTSFR